MTNTKFSIGAKSEGGGWEEVRRDPQRTAKEVASPTRLSGGRSDVHFTVVLLI